MRGVSVGYGGEPVLVGADLVVAAGEVHALLGANGAGKSSLLKALAGAVPLQAGHIELDGEPFAPRDPLHASRCGIAMIHQELSVLPHLSVADNVLLGREAQRFGLVDRRARDAAAATALALLGHHDVPLCARTGDLPPGRRQLVEIARALSQAARVLVMDEPTSSLDGRDLGQLLAAIELLRQRGLAIVYVSHVLAEVRAVASRATVLRDGHTVCSGDLAAIADGELIRHMAGRPIVEAMARPPDAHRGPAVLTIAGLAGVPLPRSVTLQLHRGEVLGIGGLCGSGRTELIEVLCGLRRRAAGTVHWSDRPAVAAGDPTACWANGIGVVAEDRKLMGLATARSIAHNVILPRADRHARRAWLRPAAMAQATLAAVQSLRVRSHGPWQIAGDLSGGNQQKVAFARLFACAAEVLLIDEPTRGIDVGSRQDIYAKIHEQAARGAAILVVSSQLPELLALCDRIAVMRDGVLGEPRPAAQWTQETLLQAALRLGGGAS